MNPLKSMNSGKIMSFLKSFKHNHAYIMLFIIICIAIFIFSMFNNMREGFTDEDVDTVTIDYDSSYIEPADNNVLCEKPHKHTKKCRRKRKNNGSTDNNESTNDTTNDTTDNEPTDNNGPLGIPRSQIPRGDEDLYILKSDVVPPVCPACPNVTVCPNSNNNKPPPCPPCARCPEPAFDCKKVPNYNSNNSEYLPRPVLADFSQFGM